MPVDPETIRITPEVIASVKKSQAEQRKEWAKLADRAGVKDFDFANDRHWAQLEAIVRKHTGLQLGELDKLTMPDQLAGYIDAAIAATPTDATPASGASAQAEPVLPGALDRIAAACGLVVKHPDRSDRQIAKQVGLKSSGALTRSQEYQRAKQASVNPPPPRGSKGRESGHVEAESDRADK